MTLSASPVPRTLSPANSLLLVLAVGTALSPLYTKIAGATWLLWCLWGIALRLGPRAVPALAPHPALPAVHLWAAGCAAAMGFAMLKAGYWNDPFDEVYAYLRLLLSAAAAWWVLSRVVLPTQLSAGIAYALAGQAAAALACVAWVGIRYQDVRNFLPANAIPWAQAIAFCICLLMPIALRTTAEEPAWRRKLWWLALALAAAALLTSQSRGAYGVFAWMLCLLALRWREVHRCWPVRRMAALVVVAGVTVAAVWWAPGDPLRVRLAEQEIVQAETRAEYDTSMGVRMYLWAMAIQGLRDSPLVGVGETERMRRIQHAGEELPEPQRGRLGIVRTMGHVHNQYLHAALDGGVIGLGAVFAVIFGLAGAAWRLRSVDSLASRQMQGLLFVHVLGGLTNVNFAHNYYVVTLSIASAIVLLGVRRRSPDPAAA